MALVASGLLLLAGGSLHPDADASGSLRAELATLALLAAGRVEEAADYGAGAREELPVFRELFSEPVVLLAEGELVAAHGASATELLERAEQTARDSGAAGMVRRVRAARARLGA